MAADQRRKRLNGASIVGCNSREQHKAKKKSIGFLQDDSNIKSHISLEWDQKKNRVVAKRDQIGVSCRNLRPFVDSSFNSHKILADVCAVPHGIYDLENLEHVLSYEVWQTHLSENERNHLMQFLPRGSEAEQVVEALLDGDFFDFGNPLLKWGASLCSGDLHPDAILIREQYLQTDKNAYYKGLQKYHTDMIAYLLKLKEICASSKDSEHEIVRKMWRSRNDVEKQTSSHANESRFRDLEENVVTSESCSWAADEKACSSDNQISSLMKGEVPNRIHEKGFLKDKGTNFLLTADKALNIGGRSKKGDQPNKRNIYGSDGSKYMSYVKISKKQYEIFKSMKQSGKNIQSRSLNRVLGNLDSFNVQPYEVFVEEEQKKLHQHWLKLANRDLPAAYEKWMEMHLQRRQMMVCLEKDMKIRLNSLMEDDEGEKDHESVLQDEIDVGATNHQVPLEDDDNSVLGGSQADDCNPTDMEEDEKSPKKLPGGDECNSTYVDSEHFGTESDNDPENHIIRESDHSPPNISKYAENLNCVDAAVNPGAHLCASGGVWKAVRTPHSYYDSTIGHQYPSASELSLAHPHVNEEQRTQLVALESALPVGDTGKDLLHRQSVNGSFSSYPNQDRNELHSLFKGQSMLSYNHEQIQTGLDLRPPTNVFLGDSHFPGHFEEQQHQSLPLELGQKRDSEVYMQQNLPENMYSDGGRYLISRHEDLAPVNGQDWAINGVRMPGPLQSHLDGGEMLSHNWFSGGHQVRGGWSASGGTSVTNQSIGSGANGDQSLFSVLSHCNQLRSSGPYHAVASTEQFISRGYGMVGGVSPRIGNVLPPAAHALDYMGGRETADVMTNDDMQWINLPHPNSGLRDPMGKPFLRSWNHVF